MLDRQEAKRLYADLMYLLTRLDLALFAWDEADALVLNKEERKAKALAVLRDFTDKLQALVNLGPMTKHLVYEVDEAVKSAHDNPLNDVEMESSDCPQDGYDVANYNILSFRSLAGRIASIYGISVPEYRADLGGSKQPLLSICQNLGTSIDHLYKKKMLSELPSRESQVKHLLYSHVRACFPDSLPDGKVVFEGDIRTSEPDVSVPSLRTCIELKVVRDLKELDKALGELLIDQSKYGSDDYDTFLAMIYTSDDTITQAEVEKHQGNQARKLAAVPAFNWQYIAVLGPLKSD